MITKEELIFSRNKVASMLEKAGLAYTKEEFENIEVADFGLNDLAHQALQVITYINSDRYCAKELILFAGQTCPEHRHPSVGDDLGKQETFRVRWGKMWLYVEGESTKAIKGTIPKAVPNAYTVLHEVELNPGDQYTLQPNRLHWFQAGEEGVIVSEFSSSSSDEIDIFSDKRIKRTPEYQV